MTTAKLILTAFIVNLVLPSSNLGHPTITSNSNQGATRNSGPSPVNSDVQQNFQSLIESVVKSDSRRSQVYRGVLKDNVANGLQAFDTMKDEIQTMQRRNVGRRKDRIESGMHHSENVSPVKRETKEDPLKLEDLFVEKYGNDYNTSGVWEFPRENRWDHLLLTEACDQAHSFTRKPDGEIIDAKYFADRQLSFRQPKYKPMIIDLIFYVVNYNSSERHYYGVTKGLKSDCMTYLTWPVSEFPPRTFMINEHVCNIVYARILALNHRMLPYMQVL